MHEGIDGAGRDGEIEVASQELSDLIPSQPSLAEFADEFEVGLRFGAKRFGRKLIEELTDFRFHGEFPIWQCEGSGGERAVTGAP